MTQSPRPPDEPHTPQQQAHGAARFIGAVFGIAFAGIGLTVIASLWGGGMGDPPVFFKLVGSFMGLIFVAVGGAMAVGAITGGGIMAQPKPRATTERTKTSPAAPAGYTCPHCGGGLDRNADVSPMGDVKCAFCGRWFNVHGRR